MEQNLPEDLLKSYKLSISGKISRIDGLIKELEKEFRSELLITLREELHKIAGSAGCYGFPEVSDLCKKTLLHSTF